MSHRRSLFPLALLVVSVAFLVACGAPPPPSDSTVAEPFRAFYATERGRMLLGEPVSPEMIEGGLLVQYFQNGRLEHHPDAPPESRVVLSELGRRLGVTEPPVPPRLEPGSIFFPETGHNLSAEFAPFYLEHGGAAFFGPPISEVRLDHGQLVQYFTRAALFRDEAAPRGQAVRLARLGALAYDGADLDSAGIGIRLPPREILARPFEAYTARFGGERIFGRALTAPYVNPDGQTEQVYERAVLIEDPAHPAGARLAPLGLDQRLPDPPAAPKDAPAILYFPKYGHNVAFAFAEFFQANGGLQVFGDPTSEMLLEGDLLVQYFENARLEWHFNVPAAVAVQLTPYGEAVARGKAAAEPTPAPPATGVLGPLTVVAWAEYPILPLSTRQTVHVAVRDPLGGPVAGATVLLAVSAGPDSFTLEVPPTDGGGRTGFSFSVANASPGDFVNFDVAVLAGDWRGYVASIFVTWFSASGE